MKNQYEYYNQELQLAEEYVPEKSYFMKQWNGFTQAPDRITIWDTGMSWELLSFIGRTSVYHPAEFVSISQMAVHVPLIKYKKH